VKRRGTTARRLGQLGGLTFGFAVAGLLFTLYAGAKAAFFTGWGSIGPFVSWLTALGMFSLAITTVCMTLALEVLREEKGS
jgi:hypothetical protein